MQRDAARVSAELAAIVAEHHAEVAVSEARAKIHYYLCRDEFRLLQGRGAHVATPNFNFAALMLFLNHSCFNGLWRVNSRGRFNVSYGTPSTPSFGFRFPSEARVAAASAALQGAELRCADYSSFIDRVGPGDLVFVDPPYSGMEPAPGTRPFQYGGTFGPGHQQWLAFLAERCMARGAAVLLTNGDFPGNRAVYARAGLTVVETAERRAINTDGKGRGKVPCLLAYGCG